MKIKINMKRILSFLCMLALTIMSISGVKANGETPANNCLKVVTGVNQWEGVNISAENLNLEPNNKYHFSVDIFTPDFEVGIIFQISGGGWDLVFTENFDDTRDKRWRTVEGDMDFSNSNLLNEDGKLNFNEFQLTKTGDKNTDKKVTFYIDNFTVTNTTNGGETTFSENFENSTHKFRANNGSVSIVSDPSGEAVEEAGTFPINFTDGSLHGFAGRGSALVSVAETNLQDGALGKALYVTGRSATWHGAMLDISDEYEPFYEHQVSAVVKADSDKEHMYYLKAQVGEGDNVKYEQIAQTELSAGKGFVKLSGTIRFYKEDIISLYIESDDPEGSFYVQSMDMYVISGTKTGYDPSLPSLKDVYKDYFMLGNIINPHEIGTTYYDLVKHHFNTLTFENSMKPDAMWGDSVYPNPPSFWVDEHIKKIIDDGFTLIGHTLSWHGQSPNWLNVAEGSRDKKDVVYKTYEEAKANLKSYISTIAGHYYNNADGLSVYSWDVLNEAIDYWGGDPVPSAVTWKEKATGAVGWLSPLYGAYKNGYEEAPWDYIYDVFLFAREADPNAILYYNDYNMQNAGKATLVMNMVNDINARYAEEHPEANGRMLIEGIGMQEHQDINTKVSDVEASIKKFISTGAKISITELDIGIPGKTKNDTLTKEEEIKQALCYANMFKLFMEYSDYIERVSFWGVDDMTSWREDLVCIFNGDLSPKEAFYAVLDPIAYLNEHDPALKADEDDSVQNIEEPEETTPVPTATIAPTETEEESVEASVPKDTNGGIHPAVIVVIIVAAVSAVAGVTVFVMKRKKKDKPSSNE